MRQSGALVDQAEAVRAQNRRWRPRLSAMMRTGVITAAVLSVTAGVWWLKIETPNPAPAYAERQSPLAEARSLKPPPQIAEPAGLTAYTAKKDPPPPAAVPQRIGDVQALKSWPREVALTGTPEVETVSQDTKTGEFIYRTEHFEFSCDAPLGPDVVRHFARAFEATYRLNCLLPLDLKPAPEPLRKLFLARILSSDEAFSAAGAVPGSAGFYSRGEKRIYVPASSLGVKMVGGRVMLDQSVESHETLIHEITHQMMNRWLPLLPVWLVEGSAEYAGAADFVHGRFFLGQMQDRLKKHLRERGARQMGTSVRFGMLNVAELLAMDSKTWTASMATPAASENYASALLLTFYLYHLEDRGDAKNVIALLRAVEAGMPQEQAVRDFILAGRGIEELEREISQAYLDIGIGLQFTRRGGAIFKP